MIKFLVHKGWEGFGDRLECLSYSILTAKRFNRVLYGDWTDTIWREGFYRYFHFTNLPYIDDPDIIAETATVWPSFWQHKLMLPANDWVYEYKDKFKFEPLEGMHWEDVWVQVATGFRQWNMPVLSAHLRLNKDIIEEIGTTETDLPVVHLRGTDRKFTEESWLELRQKAPVAHVISDDQFLIDRWMNESPDSVCQSKPVIGFFHKSIGPKHQSNISLLKDFITLSEAKDAYALNSDSRYFKQARIVNTKLWKET